MARRKEGKGLIDLIIFDLDGTLVKLPIDYDNMRREICEATGDESILDSPLLPFIQRQSKELRLKIFGIMDKYERRAIEGMYVDPTIRDAFGMIKNYKLALVTMQGRNVADKILNIIGIREMFSMLLSREVSLSRTEQLRIAVEKLRASTEKTFFIADRETDYRAAVEVGVKPVIIGRTINNRKIMTVLDAVKFILEHKNDE